LIIAFYSPVSAAINETVKTQAKFVAQDFASGINMLENAPDGTVYAIGLPKMKCDVKIYSNYVNAVSSGNSADAYFNVPRDQSMISMNTPCKATDDDYIKFQCDAFSVKKITLAKSDGMIVFQAQAC